MSCLIIAVILILLFFFFNDTATTEIYTLSLHDALPISCPSHWAGSAACCARTAQSCPGRAPPPVARRCRSEEHTSELQSHLNLVCRLLLEKKTRRLCTSHRDNFTTTKAKTLSVHYSLYI